MINMVILKFIEKKQKLLNGNNVTEFVNNLIYIIIFVLLAIYVIDKRKNKYKDDIKNKMQ